MKIKSRLILALSIILVTAFTATSLVNYTIARKAVREELLNSSLPLTGKNIYSEIHAAIMRPLLVSSSMATDTFLKDWIHDGEKDLDAIRNYLDGIKQRYGFMTTFFVSANTDRYYYPGGSLKRISPRNMRDIWYYTFVASKKEYELNVDLSQQDQDALTIFVNFRLEDKGKFLGVVGVGLNMNYATALLRDAQEKYGRNVYLVDQDGLVQVHPEVQRLERFYITESEGIDSIAEKILQPRTEAANFEYDKDSHHYLISTHYLQEFEWHLIVEQDEGEALMAARNNMIRTLLVGLGVSLLIIFLCAITINHFQKRLERMANTDPLTGAANRNALEEQFKLAAYKAQRYEKLFTITIIDMDNFKEINDRHGHLIGDKVLKFVAETIISTIRPIDTFARWGGDEFIVLMEGSKDDALAMANRICQTVAERPHDMKVAFSCGISQYRENDTIDAMTQRADKALYRAKSQGGNCSVSGSSPEV